MEDSGDNPFADPTAAVAPSRGYGSGGVTSGATTATATTATTATTINNGAGRNNLFQEYDPFGDLGAQPAATSSANDPLEGYNPFDKGQKAAPAAAAPAVLQTDAPPPYTPTAAQQVNVDLYLQQQQELDKKAKDLEDVERRLQQQEQQLKEEQRRSAASGVRADGSPAKNWPPLPAWFPLKACFYQDIDVEIPHTFQHLIKQMYYLWLYHICVFFLCFIGFLALLFTGHTSLGSVLIVLILCVLLPPCTFVCWFRPVYKAFRSDSSLYFMVFFLFFVLQAVTSVIMALWALYDGIETLTAKENNVAAGMILVVVGVLFSLQTLVDFFMLVRIHRLYRGREGVSMQQGRQEFQDALRGSVGTAAAGAAAEGLVGAATTRR